MWARATLYDADGNAIGVAANPLVTSATISVESLEVAAAVQYADGTAQEPATGIPAMWNDSGTVYVASATKPFPVSVETATVNVSATNLDIRDLTSTDVVTIEGGNTTDVKVTLDSEEIVISSSALPTGAASETTVASIEAFFTGSAVATMGYYSGTASTYQTLVTWTVGAGKTGYIHDISFACRGDDVSYAQFELMISGATMFTNVYAVGGISFPLNGLATIAAGESIIIKGKSDGSHTSILNGSIAGREV